MAGLPRACGARAAARAGRRRRRRRRRRRERYGVRIVGDSAAAVPPSPHMAAVTGELHVRGASRGAVSVDAPGLLSDALVAAKAQVMALVSAELAGEAAAGPGARRRRAL